MCWPVRWRGGRSTRWRGLVCAAVQALFSAGWTISANRLYFSLHKPKRTVVIYRDESDLRKLEEIRFFAERWSVERTVQWDEENVHDLPYAQETPGGLELRRPSRS